MVTCKPRIVKKCIFGPFIDDLSQKIAINESHTRDTCC